MVPIDFIVGEKIPSQWGPSTVLLPTFFKVYCSAEERNSYRFGTT